MKTWKMLKMASLKKYSDKAQEYCSYTDDSLKQYFCQRVRHLAYDIDDLSVVDTSSYLVTQGIDLMLKREFEILDTIIFIIDDFHW